MLNSTVDIMARSALSSYTSMVVEKLQQDGAGASAVYSSQEGFVPLPAVFIGRITSDVVAEWQSGGKRIGLSLRSRWNLNAQQGLQDAFEREGWEFLAEQHEEQLALGGSLTRHVWKPFVEMVTVDGKKSLHYLSADPAAHKSCVACHNKWESKEKIKAIRDSQGIEAGKVFKMGELMGALSIVIPVEQ